MTTLATINGEALAVPGLEFRPVRNGNRVGIVAQDARGAVEVWHELFDLDSMTMSPEARALLADGIGGVEVHSRRPMFGLDDPNIPDCDILGGPCWTDGSSLAWRETFAPMVHRGDAAGVLRELADWHRAHFGGAS